MRVVIQRVSKASVYIEGSLIADVGKGLLVLLGISKYDTEKDIDYITGKIKSLRIFEDESGKMSENIDKVEGEVLLVSQFTLYGDCSKGARPSFDKAAKSDVAIRLYERFIDKLKAFDLKVSCGRFGEKMDVSLTNSGPVTIIIDSD